VAARFQIHPNQIAERKNQLQDRASEVGDKKKKSNEPDIKELYAKIGQLAMENDFLSIALGRVDGLKRIRNDYPGACLAHYDTIPGRASTMSPFL
jgi:hypothetical protein